MKRGRFDITILVGLGLAVAAIVGGQRLEGGHLSSILQPTAALIVFGGTLGAVVLQFPLEALRRTVTALRRALAPPDHDTGGLLTQLATLATRARRDGLIALDRDVDAMPPGPLARWLQLAVDGVEHKRLRVTIERELDHADETGEVPARVLEAAGGYAPTVGILGAVLGLIHVMENLSDPGKLGGGIAVAFVATVYGVGVANLVLLPLAGKLKTRHQEAMLALELISEGVLAIVGGDNPRMLERTLAVYVAERRAGKPPEAARARAQEARGAA